MRERRIVMRIVMFQNWESWRVYGWKKRKRVEGGRRIRYRSVMVEEVVSSVLATKVAIIMVHCTAFGNVGLELMGEDGVR